MIPSFPNLEIVLTQNLVLHEQTDRRRVKKMKRRLLKDGCLNDPVIVAPLTGKKYVVLDGANRVTAFRQLKIKFILVQILTYKSPQVKLETWNHLICDKKFRKIFSHQQKKFKKDELAEILKFTSCYKDKYGYLRVLDNSFDKLKRLYPGAVCLMIFPKFKLSDIIKFAQNRMVVPAGITRHIINGRALGVHLPLKFLQKQVSLSRINQLFLNKINQLKHQVRFYQESVFLFNV